MMKESKQINFEGFEIFADRVDLIEGEHNLPRDIQGFLSCTVLLIVSLHGFAGRKFFASGCLRGALKAMRVCNLLRK
jgi:hypothetical protein